MVTVRRQTAPEHESAEEVRSWVQRVAQQCHLDNPALLQAACERALGCEQAGNQAGRRWPYGIGCYRIGREMAEILIELRADNGPRSGGSRPPRSDKPSGDFDRKKPRHKKP